MPNVKIIIDETQAGILRYLLYFGLCVGVI